MANMIIHSGTVAYPPELTRPNPRRKLAMVVFKMAIRKTQKLYSNEKAYELYQYTAYGNKAQFIADNCVVGSRLLIYGHTFVDKNGFIGIFVDHAELGSVLGESDINEIRKIVEIEKEQEEEKAREEEGKKSKLTESPIIEPDVKFEDDPLAFLYGKSDLPFV